MYEKKGCTVHSRSWNRHITGVLHRLLQEMRDGVRKRATSLVAQRRRLSRLCQLLHGLRQ